MCRIARDFGDTSLLLPRGIDSLYDLPYPIFEAVRMSVTYLQFQELPEDEAPDRSIWMNPKALGEHFEKVKRDREARFSPNSNREIDDPVQNEAASLLLVGDD